MQVALWDLRGGKGAPAFGARGVSHHSQLETLHIPSLMGRIPQLRQEVGDPPQSCVQSIRLDPRDDRRLGFNLRCGWSGKTGRPPLQGLSLHVGIHACGLFCWSFEVSKMYQLEGGVISEF